MAKSNATISRIFTGREYIAHRPSNSKTHLPKEQGGANPQQPKLLGELPTVTIADNHKIEKPPIDKTLAGPIFWRGDAEYLDEIERILGLCAHFLEKFTLPLEPLIFVASRGSYFHNEQSAPTSDSFIEFKTR